MTNRNGATRRILFTSAAGIAMLASGGQALAQDSANTQVLAGEPLEPETNQQTIVVTGSLIRGTPEDAALPVDVFSADELEEQGVQTPLDFIKELPSVGGVLGDSNQFSSAAQGLAGVGSLNLRGLGSQRTLVLLNGRRTIRSPGDGIVNTNLLPLFALQRIELLKDGAAVTYGSDAIAGVANFITRDRFEGIELSGDYRFIDGSDGDYSASILAGQNLGDFNIMAGFEWQHRSNLPVIERDFASLPYSVNPAPFSSLGNPSSYFPAIRYFGPIRDNPNNTSLARGGFGTAPGPNNRVSLLGGATVDAGCDELGGVPDTTSGLPICRFSYTPFNNLVENSDTYVGYAQLDGDLSDRIGFHADFTYARRDGTTAASPSYPPTQSPTGPGASFNFFVPETNPGFADFVAQTGFTNPLPPGTPGRGALLFLGRPLALGGNPLFPFEPFGGQNTGYADAFRISSGLEVELNDALNFDLFGTYIDSKSSASARDVVGVRLQNALDGLGGPNCDVATGTPGQGGCLYFNPFSNSFAGNPALGLSNPFYTGPNGGDLTATSNDLDLIEYLFEGSGSRQQEKQFVVDALLSGLTGIDFGGGDIAFGVGLQYRKTDYTSRPINEFSDRTRNPCPVLGDQSCAVEQGPFIFLGQNQPVAVEEEVFAVLGELDIPLSDSFNVNLAARFEDYGGAVGSTFDPKASVRWQATDFLALRGSVGTTFRAPLPNQVGNTSVTTLQNIIAAGSNFRSVDVFGNPTDLGPETAFTYNVGAILDVGGFTATVDYWSYDFEGKIVTTPAQAIANAVISGPGTPGTATRLADCSSPFVDLVTFQGGCVQGVTTGGDISRIRTEFVNGPDTKTSGLDIAADYRFDAGPGVLSLGTNASIILEYEISDFDFRGLTVSEGYDALGFANYDRDPGTVSRLRANGYVNYRIEPLNIRYSVRYVDGVTDNRCPALPAPCAVTSFGETNFGREVDSFTQHDLNLTYTLDFSGMEAVLQAGVENIFDEDPPAARLELGYDPFLGNPLGRTYRIGATVTF